MQTGKAISVPAILKVGNGTLNQLGSYLKGGAGTRKSITGAGGRYADKWNIS